MILKKLFSQKPTEEMQIQSINPVETVEGINILRKGETYLQYGIRICANSTGSNSLLAPCLQRVYFMLKKEQFNNEQLQEQFKTETQNKIDSTEHAIKQKQADMDLKDEKIRQLEKKEEELKNERTEILNHAAEINKNEKIKLILGIIILVPLTLYLFIFYGSTFYSAFFKDFTDGATLSECMFDPAAYSHSLQSGFMALIFVVCAPIIFMGLGFSLHFFSINKTDNLRFVKIGSVLVVTFLFDMILAYSIGKNLDSVEAMTTMGEHPEYTISRALTDIHLWAVIFCGFIVYIIGGIVFGMIMTAYDNMYTNKTRLNQIKEEINQTGANMAIITEEKTEINKSIIALEEKKAKLMRDLNVMQRFDPLAIKHELINFFTGWVKQLTTFNVPNDDMKIATSIYEHTLITLFPNNNNKDEN